MGCSGRSRAKRAPRRPWWSSTTSTTRILNKRDGRVYQVILNVLSEDGNRIDNEYVRLDENGDMVRISHAIYDRIK